MPKSKSSDKSTKPAAASTKSAPAAKQAKPAKSSGKSKKVAAVVAETAAAPAPEPVVAAPAPVATEATTVSTSSVSPSVEETDPITLLESQFEQINTRLAELRALELSIVQDVRTLQKNAVKLMKTVAKRKNKRRAPTNSDGKREPSGFAKPSLISNELCSFLGKPKGSEMARTEVTKFITNYIKDNGLQDPANKRRIVPDKKLAKLLNYDAKKDTVTYFNLQRYMKVHFPPAKTAAVQL